LTRCCQSNPAMPKFAVPMVPPDVWLRGLLAVVRVGENPSLVLPLAKIIYSAPMHQFS
jgi:hypothetical protein